MRTRKASTFAEKFIKIHLGNEWRFMFDGRTNRLGSTQFERRIITLSKPVVELNDEAQILDALRHEVAHAKTGIRDHDETWARACREIGGTARPYIDRKEVKLP